jgi:hypothetical protein
MSLDKQAAGHSSGQNSRFVGFGELDEVRLCIFLGLIRSQDELVRVAVGKRRSVQLPDHFAASKGFLTI